MYKSNKDVPPKVLSILQPYYNKENELFVRAPSNPNYLVKFIDSDINSPFFFEITSHVADANGVISFWVAIKPGTDFDLESKRINLNSGGLDGHFNLWFNNLRAYTKLKGPIEQDFILKQYQEEFYSEFQLVDEDANTTSFDYQKQVLLDKYLDKMILVLEQAKTDTNTKEIEDVKQDVVELKNNQTKLTKQLVIQCISKIFAKARKIGLPILMLVKDEAIKELAKEGIKAGIKFLTGG